MNDICCPLNETAHISVNQPGVAGPDGVLLYSELEQCVCATAKLLQRHAWAEGERVVLALPLDWKTLVLLLAIMRQGGVACPVNPETPAEELKEIIRALDATRLVTNTTRKAAFSNLGPSIELIEEYVGYIDKMKARHRPRIPLKRMASILTCREHDAPALYAYSYGAHYYSALGINHIIRITAKDRWLSAVPLYRPGGLDAMFRCIVSGAVLALPAPGETLIEAIEKYDVTHVTLTVDQLKVLLNDEASVAVLREMKDIVVFSGETPADILPHARRQKLNVFGAYISPCSPGMLTCAALNVPLASRDTSGQPHAYCKVRLNEAGDIECAGHALAEGRMVDGHLVPFALAEGWLRTGDQGAFDAAGCLVVSPPTPHAGDAP
ncbi:MAG: hypothetical protein EOM20_05445 [Spartobacteria bacterium]|nr:hypothetical protein [Spartobacteria bacterium]